MADLSDQQMTFQRRITPHLEVRQPQLALLVFQATLDGPAPKGHVQDRRQRHTWRRVADEVLDLVGVQHVARQGRLLVLPRLAQRLKDIVGQEGGRLLAEPGDCLLDLACVDLSEAGHSRSPLGLHHAG